MSKTQLQSPMKLAKSLGRRPQVIYSLLRRHPELVHVINGKKMVDPQEVMKYLGAPRTPRRGDTDEDFRLPTGFKLEGAWYHVNLWVFPDETNRPKWPRGRSATGKEVTLSRRRLYKLIKQGKIRPLDVDALIEALLELKKNHPDTYNQSYETWKKLTQPEEEE